MAKSGQIVLTPGMAPGDLPLSDAVVFTESTPTNLGGVVADLMEKSADPLKIVVNIDDREVLAFPTSKDLTGLLDGTEEVPSKLVGTITRDDVSKKSSPVTRAAGDDISASTDLTLLAASLDDMFDAVKPSKSAAAVVNAVEDAIRLLSLGDTPVGVSGVRVVIDQTGDGSIKVYGHAVEFPTTAGERLAWVKQTLPTDAGGPPPLPFE